MSFFRKLGRGFRHLGGEIGGAFRKSASTIGGGVGSLVGRMGGTEIGAGIGSVFGPEGTLAGGAIGGIIGSAVGSEVGKRTVEHAQRGGNIGQPLPVRAPAYQKAHEGKEGRRAGHASVPIKIPKLPSPAPKPILGRDGHGQRQRPTNELEKTRREPKKQELFM
jgi:hypothetical protein